MAESTKFVIWLVVVTACMIFAFTSDNGKPSKGKYDCEYDGRSSLCR